MQIDALDEAVEERKAVGKVVHPRLEPFHCEPLRHEVLSGLNGNADLVVDEPVRTETKQLG